MGTKDTDGDGISDGIEERLLKTDPEIANSRDELRQIQADLPRPANIDRDRDGSSDVAEMSREQNSPARGDAGGDGVSDLQEAMSGADPTIADHHGLGSVDDEMFADPLPALGGDGTVSLNVRPTPSEPDDLMVVTPPPPPPVDLIDETLQVVLVTSVAGELDGKPSPPTPSEPDDIVEPMLPEVLPDTAEPAPLETFDEKLLDEPALEIELLDEI